MEMSLRADSTLKGPTGSTDIETTIHKIYNAQKAHRWELAATTAVQRKQRLQKFKEIILKRQQELKDALYADFRKPAAEVELTELQPVLAEINHTLSHLKKWMKPQAVKTPFTLWGTRSCVRHEPKGMVLLLSPWNYPFNLTMSPLIAAVAAGNTVLIRPSDKVKRTSAFMKNLIEETFPQNEVAMVTGPSSVSNILLALPFDHIIFTGSTRIGKQIMASAAQHLASVTLELGGQSPVIIDESADIKKAAECVVWGKFLNAGQTCVAPNHVFIHQSKQEEFLGACRRLVEERYGATAEARKQSLDFARIVDDGSVKRLCGLIDEARTQGAQLVIGGGRDTTTRYIEPTVLAVKTSSAAMKEEIFGPILPVISYDSLEDVIQDVRSRGKPLAMYIFSRKQEFIDHVLTQTTAGGTVVNNVVLHLGNPDLPFGGVGESGQGNYHGFAGFRTFSHERAVLIQGAWLRTVQYFYPPYTPQVQRMLGWLTKYLGM